MSVFVANALFGHVFPVNGDSTGAHVRNAGDGMDELCLAVAVNTGDTDDFASLYLEGNIMYQLLCLSFPFCLYRKVLYFQHNISWFGRSFVNGQVHLAANHHL